MITPRQPQYAREVIRQLPTPGHYPLLVMTEDFEWYVAKSGKTEYPPVSLINEFLCAYLLQLWEVPTPPFSPIHVAPELILPGTLAATSKASYYQRMCFGSQYLVEAIELSEIFSNPKAKEFERISNLHDLLWINLFDLWVENEDRRPSNFNLLMAQSPASNQLTIYAIDHAFCFLSGGYSFLDAENGVLLTEEDSLIRSPWVRRAWKKAQKTDEIKTFEDRFLRKVQLCKDYFINIAHVIPAELGFDGHLQNLVSAFLFDENRNRNVIREFYRRLGS